MSELDVEATAQRYFEIYGEWAWLRAGLIADRHYAKGEMRLFHNWWRVAQRLDEVLPWVRAAD